MEDNYIDFKFGDHWASEFHLIAVSNSDRYSPPIFGNINSNTSTVVGKTGVYKWKTQIGEKNITINVAFDKVTMQDVNRIKQWLNPKEVKKLILSEEPYKYYWCSIASEPDFRFLPFEEETIMVGNKEVIMGVYKGELTLQFICIDNFGYSDYNFYNTVEVKKDTAYKNSRYGNKIIPWITSSNLLEETNLFDNKNVYLNQFIDKESGDAETSGISNSRPVYLYNAGTTDANLSLIFDLLVPAEDEPLTINIESCRLVDGTFEVLNKVSSITINSFKYYQPFVDIFDGELDNWQIEIDSALCEVYIKHKSDKNKVVNLNKFNKNQSFLSLTNCNFVDYLKPFPTSIMTIKDSALENTIFNKVSIEAGARNYRIKNVDVKWEHTYM